MTNVMGISELGMINGMQRLDMISHNLANASTSGFKRDIPVVRSFAAQFDTAVETLSRVSIGTDATLPSMSSAVDFTQGALRNTGNQLDLAIEGEGFFVLGTGDGAVYSRQGSFRMDGAGRLVSTDGLVVNGVGGEIRLSGNAPRIDPSGTVWEGDDVIAQLKIVKFKNPDALIKAGDGGFSLEGSARPEPVSRPSLRQGFLEASNIEVMDEMVKMMETVRHFEATRHVIQGYDEMIGSAIETIAEF